MPGESIPHIHVSLGYPPSASAYVALASHSDSDPTKQRRLQYKRGSMVGVLLASVCTFLLSVSGLGAAGYFLFTNLDSTEAHSSIERTSNPPPVVEPPLNPVESPPITPPDSVVPPQPKKPEKFELKPAQHGTPNFKAPNFAGDSRAVDLNQFGGQVGSVAVGGSGRFLVMHFPSRGVLNAYDLVDNRMVGEVTVDDGKLQLVAGFSRVVVGVPEGHRMRCRVYALPPMSQTLQHCSDTVIELPGRITAMAMGSRTNGPLLACSHTGDVGLYEVGQSGLKLIEVSRGKPGIHTENLRASPTGAAFLTYDSSNLQSVKVLTVVKNEWKVSDLPAPGLPAMSPIYPGVDNNFYGNSLVLNRAGQIQPVLGNVPSLPMDGRIWFVPSITNANQFLKVASGLSVTAVTVLAAAMPAPIRPGYEASLPHLPLPKPFKPQTILRVTVHQNGDAATPLANTPVFSNLPAFAGLLEPNGAIKPILDQHLFLVPEAKILVILTGDRTKLVLRKLNVDPARKNN
ncbi:MAG: hypothetical protein U0792_19275 [Gemmataceae bacterium]